ELVRRLELAVDPALQARLDARLAELFGAQLDSVIVRLGRQGSLDTFVSSWVTPTSYSDVAAAFLGNRLGGLRTIAPGSREFKHYLHEIHGLRESWQFPQVEASLLGPMDRLAVRTRGARGLYRSRIGEREVLVKITNAE